MATICQILRDLGPKSGTMIRIACMSGGQNLHKHQASYDLVRRMRFIYSAGLLLARLGRAEVPLPGGCAGGSRPVDYHIRVFSAGADVTIEHGYMKGGGWEG